MAAIRIEGEAFSDLRYEALGRMIGSSPYEALGRMAWLWRQCTMMQKHVLPTSIVETIVDPAKLCAAQLGEEVEGGIRIRGTRGRIEWLGERRKAARKGGAVNKAKWGAKRKPNGSHLAEPNDSPPAPAPAPAPAQISEKEPPKAPQGGAVGEVVEIGKRRKRASGLAGASPAELESIRGVLERLSERSGRTYSPKTAQHALRILRLLREGYTELDLRQVVWDRANRWAEKPEMVEYLRPSTVFGPQKFPDYLAEAKAAYEEHERDEAVRNRVDRLPGVAWEAS
jgi:uncharacterized phage protein (TIGR02220 family)